MKKPSTKKLTLDRETLVSLQADAMDAVIGGAANQQTLLGCPTNAGGRTCFLCVPDPVQ
jgi:hypothetical protein